jgi:uroporphyrinogen decarboxylase
MNSRERVLAAIEHREPDRVPIDLGATPSSGISAIAYNRIKDHLGIDSGQTRVYDVVQQLAQPEMELLDHFGVDVVDIGRTFNTADSDWRDTELIDGSKAQYPSWFHPAKQENGSWLAFADDGTPIAEMPTSGTFFDQVYFPYEDGYPETFDDLDTAMDKVLWASFVHSPWDRIGDEGFWDTLRENALQLRQQTDKALMVVVGCNLFEWGTFLRRMDNFLMDLAAEPKSVERLLDALLERHLVFLEKICRAVGDIVDIVRFGDDLGMDRGTFMSPDMYRKFFKPRHQRMCDYVKSHSQMHTFLHSCGSIYAVIPDLIEAGFEILNPVQTSCRNMEPSRLKEEFGNDITFWGGGCDTREILNLATPQEVTDHVRKRLEVFAPGGGFVFNTIHNILPDVPPENVVAMFDAIRNFNHG